MPWLSVLFALLKLLTAIAGRVPSKTLENADADSQKKALQQLEDIHGRLKKSIAARNDVDSPSELRVDDGHKRD